MNPAALAAAALLAAALAVAPLPGAAPWSPPAEEAILAGQIDVERMAATVRDLVRIGPRMGGTPSGDRAAAYLAAAFTAAGLTPQMVDDPSQPVHWEDHWTVDLAPGGRLASAWPYGFSPSVEPVLAPLVALAKGAPLPKKVPAAWRGKVVFVPGELGAAYARIAASPNRPLAILTDAPGDGKRYLDAARIGALPPVPPRHPAAAHPAAVPSAPAAAGSAVAPAGPAPSAAGAAAVPVASPRPLAVFGVSYADGKRLAAAAAAPGGARVRVALSAIVAVGQPRTVLATLPGADGDGRYYLICAHGDSDSGGPGADDNGSGEAVVLELARVFAHLVRDSKLPAPRVGLRFAVWGSEYASSGAYIAREGERLGRCAGVLNLDEVGTGAERNAIYFESNEIPWNHTLLSTLDRVGANYVGRPEFWPEYTTNPSQGGTDSYAFLPRRYQGELANEQLHIPATTVYTAAWDHLARLPQTPGWESSGTPDPKNLAIDYSRYYHSSGDTPANTTDQKPQAMGWAARAIGIALLRLTAAATPP